MPEHETSFSRRVRIVEDFVVKMWWLSLLGLLPLIAISGRNAAWLPCVPCVSIGLPRTSARWRESSAARRAHAILVILLALSFFTPLDICIRTGDRYSAGMKPVITQHDTNVLVRELESQGKHAPSDFVVYRRTPPFGCVRRAFVITLPRAAQDREALVAAPFLSLGP